MKNITRIDQEVQRGQEVDDQSQTETKTNGHDLEPKVLPAAPILAADGNGTPPPDDPFDPKRLRLSQDFAAELGVKKILLTVPAKKPDKQSFFRIHPDSAFCLQTALMELKEDRETYLVDPSLRADLSAEIVPKVLFTAITKQGVLFLLPVRLPGNDGRLDEWNRSLMEAVERAKRKWIRISANMHLGAYEIFEATANLPEPEWPQISFQETLRLAFKDRFINTPDHPVIRKLRGAV
jgi:hypothetical protein